MTALPLLLLAAIVHAAEAAAAAAPAAPVPLYLKVLAFLGVATFAWKLIQGQVPKLLAVLQPLALRGVDAFVLLVLSQPILRFLIIGNKANFLATVNALLDGLEKISDKVQERLAADLDAAESGKNLPPPEDDAAAPPTAPPGA